MLPQCEGLGLLHILQVGSTVQLRGMHGARVHGARREGGVPNGKLNLNMSAAPHTHTLPIPIPYSEAFLVEGKPRIVQGI